eukprot:CAMPEP_0196659036 /NCGR_PEP_ID=MMETSP1086-20130531/32821_1 /TAXON_ID=77921 /ORGANISM="Cyanoptyche  gloeocystis , Strain SAG4.97" /LENGTH=186 /DNA_ID=CAMNT_0041992859 /DNA_START=76 /DNA_END=635 /DNA_ORIENTATION=-
MGRSGRTGAGKPTVSSRPVSRTAAAAPSHNTASHPPAKVAPQSSHPAAPASHPPAPVVVQQGPGLLSQIASTAAGSAIGHVVGRGIADTMFGSRHEAPAPAQEAAAPAAVAAPAPGAAPMCSFENQEFKKCLEENKDGSLDALPVVLPNVAAMPQGDGQRLKFLNSELDTLLDRSGFISGIRTSNL